MKKIFLSIAVLIAGYSYTFAQPNPLPVTSGLIQHLDAAVGFVPGDPPGIYPFNAYCGTYATAVPTYAFWADQSGMGNDVKTPAIQTWCGPCGTTCSTPGTNTNANPLYIDSAWITNYGAWPAIRFDFNDFMETLPNASTGALKAANGLAAANNVTQVTLFVVRTQGSPTVQQVATNDDTHVMVSLSNITGASAFPGQYVNNGTQPGKDEFCIMRDWAAHITEMVHGPLVKRPAWLTYKDHQCFGSTPGNKPVVLSASFGSSFSDINYYVNGIASTNSLQSYPSTQSSVSHTATDRLITIGARRCGVLTGIDWAEFARCDIFEVLVYNRKLSSTEMDQVNNWLKCKYDLQYKDCNSYPANCPRACWFSPQLNITFLSKDPVTGNCSFTATVTAPTQPGITNYGYEWSVPGMPKTLYVSSATTDTRTFTMVPSNNTVTVRMLGLNSGQTAGLSCCDFSITTKVYCDDYSGGSRDKPTSITGTVDKDVKPVSIYPNPTDRDLFVKFAEDGERTIVVLDFTGKEIKRMTVTEKLNKLSFDAQAAGIYMVRIIDKDGKVIENRKVVYSK